MKMRKRIKINILKSALLCLKILICKMENFINAYQIR